MKYILPSPFIFAVFISLFVLSNGLFGQFERVEFDYANAYFNNGQPLPAEERLIITGEVEPNISLVELAIFKPKANRNKPPLFEGNWKRGADLQSSNFRVPVNYKLTGSTDYDFVITYFRRLSEEERIVLREEMLTAIDAYIQQNLDYSAQDITLDRPGKKMVEDLGMLVKDGLMYYRNLNDIPFNGFSDLTRRAIEELDHKPLDMVDQVRGNAMRLLIMELDQVFNTDLVVRQDQREVPQYETARTRRPIALNVGYGGVLLSANQQSFSYDAAPYVGISFPLANPALAGPFWSNASVSLGVFTNNFEDTDGNVVTGPIFGRPYYLGLGYNLFRFIRINAGATAIESLGTSSVGGGNVYLDVNAISIQPFIGISAEIELWAGLRDR